MPSISNVSCVLVTRGDIDLTPVLDSLPFDDVIVWNNAERCADLKVYGRYAALGEAKHDLIYTQDDDAICPAADLVEAWTDGLLVNVPRGEWPWLAWGAVFPRRHAIQTLSRYLELHPFDEEFLKWADVIVAHSGDCRAIDLGHTDLPWATAPSRMYHQPDHYTGQARMRASVAA